MVGLHRLGALSARFAVIIALAALPRCGDTGTGASCPGGCGTGVCINVGGVGTCQPRCSRDSECRYCCGSTEWGERVCAPNETFCSAGGGPSCAANELSVSWDGQPAICSRVCTSNADCQTGTCARLANGRLACSPRSSTCQPRCSTTCGVSNGCGGTCNCPSGQTCSAGVCRSGGTTPCTSYTSCVTGSQSRPTGLGHCAGEIVLYLTNNCGRAVQYGAWVVDNGAVSDQSGGTIPAGARIGGELGGLWTCGHGSSANWVFRAAAVGDPASCTSP